MESENKVPAKDYDGPCRETTLSVVDRMIETKRRDLSALESLRKMLVKGGIEAGSPLEDFLWSLLHSKVW